MDDLYIPPAWFDWLIGLLCLAPLVFALLLRF